MLHEIGEKLYTAGKVALIAFFTLVAGAEGYLEFGILGLPAVLVASGALTYYGLIRPFRERKRMRQRLAQYG